MMNVYLSMLSIFVCFSALANCAPHLVYLGEDHDADIFPTDYYNHRHKRQLNAAVTDALNAAERRGPLGQPTFGGGYHGGAFQDRNNFGARLGGNVGATVWQNGRESVGAGLGGRATGGLSNGRPFVTQPDVGGALNYRRGNFNVGAGVGYGYQNPMQTRPGMTYGVGVGYRF